MLEERDRKRRVLTSGVDAEATVIAVVETGWSRDDGLGIEIALTVKIDGGHVVTGREWVAHSKMPRPGDRIAVRHDPRDRDDWAWAGSVERRSRIHHLDIARLHPAEDRDDRLSTLAELKQRGILSESEYEIQSAEVADEI